MSDNLPKEKLVAISQAAEILGVSLDTVRRWDKAGILHSSRSKNNTRYFSIEELEKIKLAQPLTIGEVAKKLGVSPWTLRRLEEKDLIKSSRNKNGALVTDLRRFRLKSKA